MAERNKSILGRSLALLQRFRGMGWDGGSCRRNSPAAPAPNNERCEGPGTPGRAVQRALSARYSLINSEFNKSSAGLAGSGLSWLEDSVGEVHSSGGK